MESSFPGRRTAGVFGYVTDGVLPKRTMPGHATLYGTRLDWEFCSTRHPSS